MNPVFPKASRIGFGCASLGSRVDAGRGLKALSQAFERGINWFDLAPSYGDGQAEEIFSRFARSRRDKLHICTKCGILPTPIGGLSRILRPVARGALRLAPQMRRAISRARAAPRRNSLTADIIHSGLNNSLNRLKIDYVDVFALHDPDGADIVRDDVVRALSDILQSGKARAIGIAGSVDAALLALRNGLPVRHLQFADAPQTANLQYLKTSLGETFDSLSIATHSVFKYGVNLRGWTTNDAARGLLALPLGDTGGKLSPRDALNALALRYALKANANGIAILSMFSHVHLDFNLHHAAASNEIDLDAVSHLFRRLTEGAGPN